MTALLLTGAVAALLLDAAGLSLVIGHGFARELNPLISGLPLTVALLGKAGLIDGLALLVVLVARSTRRRRIRFAALRGALVLATGAGVLGAVSTFASAVG